ncbi:unnamed protein product [Linum trigynum]|uniref:BHLH domain-containing protein n=1 Tax=Linum trigynum TaxID=586398 RepID=A0AAV2FD98_9ROSI
MKSHNSSSNTLVEIIEATPATLAVVHKAGHINKRSCSKNKAALKNQGKAVVKEGGGRGDQLDHHVHIWTERERRKRMRTMFTNLQSLLPQLPSKVDKSSIIDEAISYIKTLHQTLQSLEKQKLEKLQGFTNLDGEQSAVSVITTSRAATPPHLPSTAADHHSCTREAFLASQGPSKSFLSSITTTTLSPITLGFETWFSPNVVLNMCGEDAQICVCSIKKQGLLVNILHILEKHNLDVVSAHISSDHHRCTYMIHAHASARCRQFPESLSLEDTFKLAAGEMNLWLLSC